jgi:hypothetical protein
MLKSNTTLSKKKKSTLTGKKSGTLIKQQIYSHNTYFDVFWTGCDDSKHNLEH